MERSADRFDYDLPEDLIAQEPIEPRDASRLLVSSTLDDRVFSDLPDLLEPGDLVVVNRTRVRAARLRARRATGGAVEVLLLERTGDETWRALVRPARKVRAGDVLAADGGISVTVVEAPVDGIVTVTMRAPGDLEEAVAAHGEVPLPPYIHAALADPERYQTVFADTIGSAAAPTAGLHFTPGVLDELAERGISRASVELSIGLDTFRPIAADSIDDHQMHSERYEVPDETADAIARTRDAGGRVVAIGTTVVRTLESAADESGIVRSGAGTTSLFITPGYRFRVVDVLVTNFHAPRTTLIVMIAAFLGDRWRDVYQHALDSGYRFLSFGDAMLVEPIRGDA